MEEKIKCYIYTRVSTEMQVEGYSLDAQKSKLEKFADLNEYEIAGFYSDEGRSGKNSKDRPGFLNMMKDVESHKDNAAFVLVYKLSRFGRKASDILVNLETLRMHGCELICLEDGINTSHGAGKLMISILAAVAEIERENIRSQSLSGREEKARQGKWNGGVPPYGYTVKDGILEVVEEEAIAVRKIFELYTTSTMGTVKIAEYLNEHGYVKHSKRKKDTRELNYFTGHSVSLIIDNPTYMGKLAYGRTKTEQIKGTAEDSHRIKSDSYILVEGKHIPIIPEEVFNKAQIKKQDNVARSRKKYNTNHINLLSGVVKCPVCGKGMYGNVGRKRKADGTLYKDFHYYYCKPRQGDKCPYRKQVNQEKLNDSVIQVISNLVAQGRFSSAISEKIKKSISAEEVEQELETLKKELKKKVSLCNSLGSQMDSLDQDDTAYDYKYANLFERQNIAFDAVAELNGKIEIAQGRLAGIKQKQITQESVLKFLKYFDKLYDKFEETEKREFLHSFISEVQIYPEKQANGQILKEIKFNFPVIPIGDGTITDTYSLESDTPVETVVCLNKNS